MGQRQGVDWLLVFSVNSVEGWMMGGYRQIYS